MENTELILMALVGLALLVLGYRIKKIAFFIIWFLLGYSLMGYLMPIINDAFTDIVNNDLWQNLLPIAGGLLMALLGFSIEKICVGGIAFGLVMMITAQYFGAEMQTLAIGAVVGVVAAGAAVMLMKPAVIIATSAAGAYAITIALIAWIPGLNLDSYYWPLIIGIAALGSIIQFLTTKRVR